MPNLTKRDLVMQISKKTGIIQGEVFAVIQQTLDAITEALCSPSYCGSYGDRLSLEAKRNPPRQAGRFLRPCH